ncbi:maleylacetoacetate isomerase [Microvirga pudoricolor]|uniref:maleylacetoacetate isomerase n=1 Tax=Microvirga pudoricolor TaxID=2778729 RepID=UPI001950EB05|nr:maleylacetoacetate isomerase [Microvirga pudoricolor]MBM6594339.1 maleylacetoacetate isomerase [Microvirga pudoricolor]
MKLYGYFRSSAAYRVRIALHLKGLSYDAIPVNLLKGEQTGVAYKAVNPQGRVPVLSVDDIILTQSPAILEYLEEVHPDPPLLPSDPLERSRVRAAASLIGCDIHPLNNTSVLGYLKSRLGQDQAGVSAWYAHWIRQGFEALETMIRPGPFAFGSRPTLADLYIIPQVYNARRFDVPLEDYPRIVAVDAACAELDAFREAAPERQPDAV